MPRLNVGCGMRKLKGYVNIDNRLSMAPDLCCDVTQGLPFEEGTVDAVRAFDFLEHLRNPDQTVPLIQEVHRVLKMGGIFEHFTPSTDGRGAFQDPYHVSLWNLNSWLYYQVEEYRALYDIQALFSGDNHDIHSGPNVIHTYGKLTKVPVQKLV